MAAPKHRGVFVWAFVLASSMSAANAQLSQLESWLEHQDNADLDIFNTNNVDDTIHDVVSLGIGVIIAIVVGCIAILVLCICCCYYCCCRSRPIAHQTVVVSQQTAAPAQPTVIVAQAAPQAVYHPQPMGPPPPQPPAGYGPTAPAGTGYDGPPPYPGQQSGYGYAKL